MSAASGITASPELATKFADAVQQNSIRFIKVSIQNESLVHDLSISIEGSFKEDLALLQSDDVLKDNVPAYILAKLDPPSPDWITFFYVPDAAQVRDKMLYASSRLSLTKALGSSQFTDSVFATSKGDLTPEAYDAHVVHVAAPNPMSSREKEMADLKAAENAAAAYEGSSARRAHYGGGPGFHWSPEAEDAAKELGSHSEDYLVILTVDPQTETLVVQSSKSTTVATLGQAIPVSEPSYALFSWEHSYHPNSGRNIVFIYSCPSGSPVKHRMVYASGAQTTYLYIKDLFAALPSVPLLNARRIETSDPTELNEIYLKTELGLTDKEATLDASSQPRGFARPQRPPRRR